MTRFVPAADANRQFSEILGKASQGETIMITRQGDPVAQLTPFDRQGDDSKRAQAWARLLSLLDEGDALGGGVFERDSLYDR